MKNNKKPINQERSFKLNKISFYLISSLSVLTLQQSFAANAIVLKNQDGTVVGENSTSIGSNSISTAKDGISVGTNAISTGDNLQKEDFLALQQAELAKITQKAQLNSQLNSLSSQLAQEQEKKKTLEAQLLAIDKQIAKNEADARKIQELTEKKQQLIQTSGINEANYRNFVNYYDVINSLDWTKYSDSSEGLINMRNQLKAKVSEFNPTLASQIPDSKYDSYLQGYVNVETTMTTSLNTLKSTLGLATSLNNIQRNGQKGIIYDVTLTTTPSSSYSSNYSYIRIKDDFGNIINDNSFSNEYRSYLTNLKNDEDKSFSNLSFLTTQYLSENVSDYSNLIKGSMGSDILSYTRNSTKSSDTTYHTHKTIDLNRENDVVKYIYNNLSSNSLAYSAVFYNVTNFSNLSNKESMLGQRYVQYGIGGKLAKESLVNPYLYISKKDNSTFENYELFFLPTKNTTYRSSIFNIGTGSLNLNNFTSYLGFNVLNPLIDERTDDYKVFKDVVDFAIKSYDEIDEEYTGVTQVDIKKTKALLDPYYQQWKETQTLLEMYEEIQTMQDGPDRQAKQAAYIERLNKYRTGDNLATLKSFTNATGNIFFKENAKNSEIVYTEGYQKALNDGAKAFADYMFSQEKNYIGYDREDEYIKKIEEIAAQIKAIDDAMPATPGANPERQSVVDQINQINVSIGEKTTKIEEINNLIESIQPSLTQRGENSIAVGTNAFASGHGAIAIGRNAIAIGDNSVAIGNENIVLGARSNVVGNTNVISASSTNVLGNNNTATDATNSNLNVVGNDNSIKGNKSSILGFDNIVDGENSTILGERNSIRTGTENIVLGIANQIENGRNNKILGDGNQVYDSNNKIIGNGNIIEKGIRIDNFVLGSYNNLKGKENILDRDKNGDLFLLGHANQIGNNVNSALVFGSENEINSNGIFIGNEIKKANDTSKTAVLGSNIDLTTSEGYTPDVVLGYNSGKVDGIFQVFSLNYLDGVKLNSYTNETTPFTTGGTDTTNRVYTMSNGGGYLSYEGIFAGNNPQGVVSIGQKGAERTIMHVGAGRINATSTDAINGSQLYAAMYYLSNGINLTAYNLNEFDKKFTDLLEKAEGITVDKWKEKLGIKEYKAGDNITISSDGKISISSDFVGRGSDENVKYSNENKDNVSLLGNDGTKITNLKDGVIAENSTDAVTGNQLHKTNEDVKKVAEDLTKTNNNVTKLSNDLTTTNNNVTKLGQDLAKTNENLTKLDNNVVKYNEDKSSITLLGSNGTKITNVANGTISEDSTDVINGSQIYEISEKVKKLKPIEAGNNIKITASENGENHIISLSDDINVKSVTTSGLTIKEDSIVNLNNNRIQNVGRGIELTDAINLGQLREAMTDVNVRIDNVHSRINDVHKKAKAGTAAAMATAGLLQPLKPGQHGFTAAFGQYQSQSAIAVGYSGFSDNGKIGVKVSVSATTENSFGGNIGIGYFW